MQKQTLQTTLARKRTLRVHGKTSPRSMHRRLIVATVSAVLLAGVQAVTGKATGSGPGESP
jgi:hypothetical protein